MKKKAKRNQENNISKKHGSATQHDSSRLRKGDASRKASGKTEGRK